MSSPSDAELVARIRAGDRTAFEQLYLAQYDALRRFASHLTASAAQADDAIQDVFTSLWIRRTSWTVQTTIRAYLAGAVRLALQHNARHEGIARRVLDPWVAADESPSYGRLPTSPDAEAEAGDLAARMTQAILALPPRRRAAILLRWHEGLSTAEIAEAMGIGARVARKLLAAAETSLRSVLETGR